MKAVLIKKESGGLVADQAWCTDSVAERVTGWFSKKSVQAGEGLLIAPCSSVHSFGMRFEMDLLFLDSNLCVVKVVRGMKPNRVAWAGARALLTPWKMQVLELPKGAAAGMLKGERLILEERAA